MARRTPPPVNNPLQYSMIHEFKQEPNNNQQKIHDYMPELTISKLLKNKYNRVWIPDSQVNECMRCGIEFGLIQRRHHCRVCLQVFCYKCTPFRKKIPDSINHDNVKGDVRVCHTCSVQVEVLNALEKGIKAMSIVGPDLQMLGKMAQINHYWKNLSDYFFGKIRNIQYRRLHQPWTDIERKLLWINREAWIGHADWTLWFILSLNYTSYNFRKEQYNEFRQFLRDLDRFQRGLITSKYDCMTLMCSGNCCPRLLPHHGAILLEFACTNEVAQEIYMLIHYIFSRVHSHIIKLYLPFLMDKLTHQKIDSNHSLGDLLINYCMKDPSLAMEFYWISKYKWRETRSAVYEYYLVKLMETLPKSVSKDIESSGHFIKMLKGIPNRTDIFDIKEYFRNVSLENLSLPFDPSLKVESIYVPKVKLKSSATLPLWIPMNCYRKKGLMGTKQLEDVTVLYKFENIRQDYIILKSIRLMKHLLATYEKVDLEIVDYHVLPLDSDSGVIEIVKGGMTAYEIKEKMKFSILNYIIENNPDETVENLRKKFVRSCATYCVVTYLFGVGDRHLDNIMITKDGKLFHIDYGFILGTDPKPISQPKIRITKDMVDALGGVHSLYYREFTELCNGIFQGLRQHLNLFISLMSVVCRSENEYKRITELLTTRFMPGETKKTAIIQLQSEIHRSTQQQNLGEAVSDFFHYHSREETLRTVAQSTQQIGQSMLNNTTYYGGKAAGYLSSWLKGP